MSGLLSKPKPQPTPVAPPQPNMDYVEAAAVDQRKRYKSASTVLSSPYSGSQLGGTGMSTSANTLLGG